MTASSAPLLEIRDLKVEFPSRRGVLVAAQDVNLTLEGGEILGVVGESGAGKSTIANAVMGLIEPPGRMAGGEILLRGERIDTLPGERMRRIRGRRIGMIFQDPLTIWTSPSGRRKTVPWSCWRRWAFLIRNTG